MLIWRDGKIRNAQIFKCRKNTTNDLLLKQFLFVRFSQKEHITFYGRFHFKWCHCKWSFLNKDRELSNRYFFLPTQLFSSHKKTLIISHFFSQFFHNFFHSFLLLVLSELQSNQDSWDIGLYSVNVRSLAGTRAF